MEAPPPDNRARTSNDHAPRGDVGGAEVLVVEDNPEVSTILAAALEDEGYVVRVAQTGRAALDLARQHPPDVITLDLGLPDGTSGREVILALRADPATAHIPVVAVSAHVSEVEPGFRAQVAQLISKPFYLTDVVEAVSGALAGQGPTPRPD